MKDKRQKVAFTWPYGDPHMFAYMLSAVAASNYPNGNNRPDLETPDNHSKSLQDHNNFLLMSTYSPYSSKSSLSPSSSPSEPSSSPSSTNSSPLLLPKRSDPLISPISLCIPQPQQQSEPHYFNYQQQMYHQQQTNPYMNNQFLLMNQGLNHGFNMNHLNQFHQQQQQQQQQATVQPIDQAPVSFKLPAFGLADDSSHTDNSEALKST